MLFLEKGSEVTHPPYPPKEAGESASYSRRIGRRITRLTPAFCNASQSNFLQVSKLGATCQFRFCFTLNYPLEHIASGGRKKRSNLVAECRAKKKPSVEDDGCR